MPNEPEQSEAEIEKTLKALASQLIPADYAKLEYERVRAKAAGRAKKEADERTVQLQWRMMIVDKIIIAAFVAYGSWYLNTKLEDFKGGCRQRGRLSEDGGGGYPRRGEGGRGDGSRCSCHMCFVAVGAREPRRGGQFRGQEQGGGGRGAAKEDGHRATHAGSLFRIRSLVEPLNGIANAGPEYALACKSGDKTRMQQINGQVCRFQTQLRVGLRDVFTRKADG